MEHHELDQARDMIERQTEMQKNYQERTVHTESATSWTQSEHASTGAGSGDEAGHEHSELLHRLYTRERDPELKQLMNRLQAAYIFSDQRQHILDTEYTRLENKAEETTNRSANRIQDRFHTRGEQEALRQRQAQADRSTEYCQRLQQQLADRQQQKQCRYEDLLAEKCAIDDMLQSISEDDARKRELKQALTERIRSEMMAFQQARSDRAEQQREMNVAEGVRIEEQVQQAADRTSHFETEREHRMQERHHNNDIAVAKIVAADNAREQKHEALRHEQEHQYEQRTVSEEQERRVKRDGLRQGQFDDMNKMLDNRKRLVEEHKQNDRDDRKRMDAQVHAEDERYRQREADKKETNRQYGDDLKQQIEENRARKLKQKQEERARDARDSGFDQGWSTDVSKKVAEEVAINPETEEEETEQGAGDHGRQTPEQVSPRHHHFSEERAQCDAAFKGLRNY